MKIVLDFCLWVHYYLFVPQQKGVKIMGIQKGTKLTDNPKSNTLKFRYDEDTKKKLEKLAKELNKSKADIIRGGIDLQFESLKK